MAPSSTTANPVLVNNNDNNNATIEEYATWDEIARGAKSLENELDVKLLNLSKLTSITLRSQRYELHSATRDGPLAQAERLAEEIREGLVRLGKLVEELASRSEQVGSSLHIVQRHRDIYAEYLKDFRKTQVREQDDCELGNRMYINDDCRSI